MKEQTPPPPGFYDDGTGQSRWWDGSDWTEQRVASPPTKERGDSKGAAFAGYVLAVVTPPLGFLYGLLLLATRHRRAGEIVWLAILVFLIEVLIGILLAR